MGIWISDLHRSKVPQVAIPTEGENGVANPGEVQHPAMKGRGINGILTQLGRQAGLMSAAAVIANDLTGVKGPYTLQERSSGPH